MKQVSRGFCRYFYDLVVMVYESPLTDRRLNIDFGWLPYFS